MEITFMGKSTAGGQSPTLYSTDRQSYVVQGWVVTDDNILEKIRLAEDETVVEIYARLLSYLSQDGLSGRVTNPVSPIVHVRENGNFIIRGRRVTDPNALRKMNIPEHETCVEVPREIMARLD